MSDIKDSTSQKIGTSVIGVFMLYLCISGNGLTGASLRTLATVFPDTPYVVISMMNTIPSLGIIVGSFIMGALMGNKISFKTAGSIAFLSYTIFGILPAFIHPNYEVILALRILWGLAAGFLAPIGSAIVLRQYRDLQVRAKVLGWGYAWKCGGNALFSIIGGVLCSIDWKATFLGYLIVGVCWVIFMITFKEPPTVEEICAAEGIDGAEFEKAKKVKLPVMVWVMLVFWCVFSIFQIPFFMNISMILAANLDSGAAVAGFLSCFIMVGGCISNALQGNLIKVFKRWTGLFSLAIACAGAIICATTGNLYIFLLACMMYGFGGQIVLPLVTLEIGNIASAGGASFAAGLIFVALNAGNFFSTWSNQLYIAIGGGSWLGTYAANGITMLIFGFIWTALTFATPTWKKKEEAAA